MSTLLRLAPPNVLVTFAQASVGLIETYFVATLGTDALAGVAPVLPVLMPMPMMRCAPSSRRGELGRIERL